ncbi:hypothetical protein DFH94DRAFT_808518, partial [Russula ochroleuca]
NFGKCSTPEIKFAKGLDNRKETAYEAVDSTSYPHGSAQNIGNIAQFVCDSLTNTCGANDAAKAECAEAQTAANAATPPQTGAQADAFNLVFGLKTNFAAVQPLDDHGNPVNFTSQANANSSTPKNTATSPSTSSPPPKTGSSLATSTNSNAGAPDFGKCTTPEIKFAVGLDGRRETAFAPNDLQSYNHGSADNIGVITNFICLALTNTCGANDAAKAQCAQAQTAAGAATPPQTGAQADAFNLVFGLKTNFAAVQPISNTGQPVAVSNAKNALSSNPVNTNTSNNSDTTIASQSSKGNLQTFTGALGGVTAPTVSALGNGQFQVENNASFKNLQSALQRSCDVQHNKCADAANASGNKGDLTVAACGTQQTQCDSSVKATA